MEDGNPKIEWVADLVEANGKTIRENNASLKHKYELGTVVDVDVEIYAPSGDDVEVALTGSCRLIVVGHTRDCDQAPLYVLSDLGVEYPMEGGTFSQAKMAYKYVANLVEFGYGEDDLRPTGKSVALKKNMREWFEIED